MKNFREIVTIGGLVLALGATSITGFAATTNKTPAEVLAGLTGKTVESLISEKQETNKTYGQIAAEVGKLDEFKQVNMEMKKANLKNQVEEGRISQEKADQIIKEIEENQSNCDGTGNEKVGQKQGGRFGSNGIGQGLGKGSQDGQGNGQGRKLGRGQARNR